MKRYVIIGNGTAAVGAIEGIRSLDAEGEITLFSSESHHTYARPLISYLLEGKTDVERMKYRPSDFYEKNRVTTHLGKTVTAVDPEKKTVSLAGSPEDGAIFPYDKLLFATGSSPFVPKFHGLEEVKTRFSFLSLDDALSLDAALSDGGKRVLIIGAGLIGLKCAEGILHRAASVTVADLASRVLSSILDNETAAPVQKKLEEAGVSFLLGHSASSFRKSGDGYEAEMDDGRIVPFDLLVLAVGVRPNTALASAACAEVGRGILVDRSMATTVPDLYAAGDCAEGFDMASGENRVLAILPNAYLQGETAGRNMAGATVTLDNAIPMNAIGFFGYHIITAGVYDGELFTIPTGSPDAVRRFFVKDNLLKGYMLTGNVERAGIYTALIRDRTPLDTLDFALAAKEPSLIAFRRSYRDEKLTAPV